jgi:hypothetical protein
MGDGSCIDIVRIRDDGNTLFESCGTAAGVIIISNTNVVTLNLVASAKLYPARGFFLQYQSMILKYFASNILRNNFSSFHRKIKL